MGRIPQSAEQVIDAVAAKRDWTGATVKSLLNRLPKEKAVAAKKDGRRYLYRPRIQRAAYVAAGSRDLLDRLYGGKLAPFIAHFAERGNLTAREIAGLKRLVEFNPALTAEIMLALVAQTASRCGGMFPPSPKGAWATALDRGGRLFVDRGVLFR